MKEKNLLRSFWAKYKDLISAAINTLAEDDPDAKAVLLNAFLNADDDAYEFTGKMVNLDVTKLEPSDLKPSEKYFV